MKWDIPFTEDELLCNCGCGFMNIIEPFVDRLVAARFLCTVPFAINSWCRCVKHNKDVGGDILSSHLKGLAVDIRAVTEEQRFRILKALIVAGFERIHIAYDFIHVSEDFDKIPCRMKLYPWPVLKTEELSTP